MEVKNYNQLCELLQIEKKSGNTKISQLNELNQYIDYTKKGHKFMINKVYDIPKIDISTNSLYINIINKLIVDLMAQEYKKGKRILIITNNKIAEYCNMFNSKYLEFKYNQTDLSDELLIPIDNIEEFYNLTSDKFNKAIKNTLKTLEDRKIIFWSKIRIICYESISEDKIYNRYATDTEITIIDNIDKETMLSLGCESMQEILKYGKYKEYRRKSISAINKYFRDNEIMSYGYVIINEYDAHKLLFSEYILREKKIADKYLIDNRVELKKLLNQTIIERNIVGYEKRYNKAIEECNDTDMLIQLDIEGKDYKVKLLQMRTDENYSEYGKTLVEYTIKE